MQSSTVQFVNIVMWHKNSMSSHHRFDTFWCCGYGCCLLFGQIHFIYFQPFARPCSLNKVITLLSTVLKYWGVRNISQKQAHCHPPHTHSLTQKRMCSCQKGWSWAINRQVCHRFAFNLVVQRRPDKYFPPRWGRDKRKIEGEEMSLSPLLPECR